MIAIASATIGWVMLAGVVIIGLITLLPIQYIETFTIRGRRGFQLLLTMVFILVVFFVWMQSRQREIREVTELSAVNAEQAERQSIENKRRIEDIERVRDDAFYTACVDRNETRVRVRGEYRAIVAQEAAFLARMQDGHPLNLSELPGYSEIDDPAVIELFESVTASLKLSREESVRQQIIEVQAAQAVLNEYIAAEPFEQCGDDPIPNEDAVRPPITAPLPQQTLPASTSSTSTTTTTTTTTTTLPPTTTSPIGQGISQTTRPQPIAIMTIAPAIPRTNPPTTTTEAPGNNGNGQGDGNAGGNGNSNGNGGRRNR